MGAGTLPARTIGLGSVISGHVLDVEGVRQRVDAQLEQFLASKSEQLADLSQQLVPLAKLAVGILGSGKRLRPAFCWWGWRGCGGDDSDAAMMAAASLEFLQAGALIHDDLLDDADTRRGMPSVHRAMATVHVARQWLGDPEEFGRAAALILGDLCLGWSDEMYLSAALRTKLSARPLLDAMKTEVMCGQYLDMLGQVRPPGPPVEDLASALTVVRYKTAKYTVERPLQLGARLAGASPAMIAGLSEYGIPLGEAFQLRDDILGVFGDPHATGKPAGDDLREGKRTVLIALAAQRAPADRDLIATLIGDRDLDEAGLDRVRAIIVDSGALREAEHMISERTTRALAALRGLRLADQARDVLARLAVAATDRTV